ncbi:MAG: hypothetical protein ACYC2T_15440 [Bacillota bacterium]
MENRLNKKPFTGNVLIILHFLLGIGALFGGLVFVIDPSGELIKMPIALLENSPFNSFLLPGLILFSVLGVLPITISHALIKKWSWNLANRLNIFTDKHWVWAFSLYIGFALIIWITIEVFFIKEIAAVHLVYIFLGLLIQAVTLLPSVQKYYHID